MKTEWPAPENVTYNKINEFVESTPFNEGVHLVTSFYYISEKRVNWALFWCWCYVRTGGFRNPCWYQNWDAGRLGEKYATSKDGIADALAEFEKFPDTDMMEEGVEVVHLYELAVKFCDGVIYHPPVEPPKPPPPVEPPKPPPPAEEPPKPEEPSAPTDWKKMLAIAGPILLGILGAASIFLPIPGWVRILVETILKAFGG